jgi:uncharacterized membrane protein YkoI
VNSKHKWVVALVLLAAGTALIAWNLRDPDRAYREPPEDERIVSTEQTPLPVQATIKRLSAGGKVEEIKEEREGGRTKYEVEVVRGDTKTEFEIAEDGSVTKQKSKKLKVDTRN